MLYVSKQAGELVASVSKQEFSIKNALIVFKAFSGGTFNTWDLMGDSKKDARQVILSNLLGKKMPKSLCGVSAIRQQILHLCGFFSKPIDACDAERDEIIKVWCQQEFANEQAVSHT